MKGKLLFCLIILFSLSANCICAQTKDDVSLFEIDRLIRRTEYDEALRLLNIYIKNKPENFDNAQIRIHKIMVARRQYSILAKKLIDLIQTDPGNNKEIYEITAQLERFERHPSDQNLQFIADLKKSAEFNYFRAKFLEIQNQSAEKTRNGQFIAAVEKTKEGFWLYREDFDLRWEEKPEIIAEVDAILADLDTQINTFEERNYLPKIQDSINDFIKAVRQEQYELALQRFSNVQNYMRKYNKLRQSVIDDGLMMQEKFAQIQKLDSDATDASFLPFMFRFVYGIDSVPNSGILGAIDGQWNALVGQMNQAVFEVLSKNYAKYELGITPEYAKTIELYVNLEQKVLDLYQIPEKNQTHYLANPYEEYYALTDYVKFLSGESLRITEVWNKVEETVSKQEVLLAQIKDKESGENRSQALYDLFDSNARLGDLVGNRSEQELDSFLWTKPYNESKHQDWDGLAQNYNKLLDGIFSKTSELLTSAWTQITQYYKENSDTLYAELVKYYESSQKYRQGFFTKIPQSVINEINADIRKVTYYQDSFNQNPELDFGINYAYPDIALKISQYVQKQIDLDISEINGYEKEIASAMENHKEWKGDERLVGIIDEASIYLNNQKNNIESLRSLAQENANLAQKKIVASQLARNEADIRYREAQNALTNENFDTARKKLQDAVSKYDESLANLNDEELRVQVDQKLQELGQEIAKIENEVVVKEVRELKTKAKDAYFNGRFEDAEKYLNQAKTRWAVTNVTEDEEISNLLNFVNTAISMKTGRDILPSAPQYPEMSQLLNLAYQYFDEGSRKIGDGNKEAGFADLDSALLNIQKLQYVYPLNQEAAILTLRINRLKDPQKFKEEFAQKIQTAKLMCQSKETRQEGYANLLDYAELQPDYPGLKDLIYQVEIDIGIRQKPVDNSGANKARRLIADAQKTYNSAGTNTKKLQEALDKLNQALALDSNNQKAIELKDQITTIIGGTTSTVLSTEDERLYQLAIQRLQNNNVVGANAIVEQLLKKTTNANSQKIKDLKNKIDART